jgi:hypothetical protein
MTNAVNIPPALPPEVVEEIWREVGAGPTKIPDRVVAFIRLAIGHPHYASTVDISKALGLTHNFTNPHVLRVKDEARRGRGR